MATRALLLTCCLITSNLQAMTWEELQREIDSVESGNPASLEIIRRFSEIVQMLVSYNRAVQISNPQTQLFCPPPNGSMDLDEIVSMVRAEARRTAAAQEALVQDLMLENFRETFPCET